MAIRGAITTRHLVTHAALIIRGFGPAVFLRCWLAIVRRKKTTFLECVWNPT